MKEKETLKKVWIKNLRKNGYRLTKQRKGILEFLSTEIYPRSADDIYWELKKKYSEIGMATVYRTLDLLSRLKLIHKVNIGSSRAFYLFPGEASSDTGIYLVCDNCGKLISNNKCLNNSVKIRLVDNAANNIFKNCKIRINHFQIFFSGLCETCSNKNK